MEYSRDPLSRVAGESPDSEDIFSSTFKGSVGKVKITATTEEIETGEEKSDPLKAVMSDHSAEEEDDLFCDCRSEQSDHVQTANISNNQDLQQNNRELSDLAITQQHCSRTVRLGEDAGATLQLPQPQDRAVVSDRPQECPVGLQNTTEDQPNELESFNQAGWQLGGRVNLEHHSRDEEDEFISIMVSNPYKVGEGISSYMAYRVSTRTNLKTFRRSSFSVVRRYSDFLGLYEKLVNKHQYKGRIIPPPPEKSLLGMTKVKMGTVQEPQTPGADGIQSKATFLSLRRAGLERFINRIGLHPVLRLDSDFVDFLEAGGDLPRATSTSTISSASVLKMITRVGETVNKMAYKMEEGDPWFEEKTTHVEQMETQLRKLLTIVESVVACRRELSLATGNLSSSLSALASCEEALHLSRTLDGLARVEECVECTISEQADADSAHLLELIRDYLALISAVKDVLGERVKLFLAWQNAVNTLHKKREQRSRLELAGKVDKMAAVLEDVTECEQKVVESQDSFNRISQVIKVEMELFQQYRVKDLKVIIVEYLEELSRTQAEMVRHWEGFLPQIKPNI